MFDLAWSEIALIVVVALVVIGPKDLPDAVRGAARGIAKLRRMAGEFQGHLDEVVREAKLEDVRDQIRDIRNFDVRGEIERAVDRDGTLRETLREDPFRAPPPTPSADAAPAAPATPVGEPPPGGIPTGGVSTGEGSRGGPVAGSDLLSPRPDAGTYVANAAGPTPDPAAAPSPAAHAPPGPAVPPPGQPEPRAQNA